MTITQITLHGNKRWRVDLGIIDGKRRVQPRRLVQELQWSNDNLEKLRGLTAAQVRQKCGLRLHYAGAVLRFLREQGVLRDGRRKYAWEQMNFALPSRDLARIWRVSFNVVAKHRRVRGLGPARWLVIGGLGGVKRRGELEEYLRALKAEESKREPKAESCSLS